MGKPCDELSDPEPGRGLGVLPWKKFETTVFKLASRNTNFCFSIRIDFTGKSTFVYQRPL